jgi:hypothetical protein
MTHPKHNRNKTKEITNNLIFAPHPHLPLLKRILDSVDESKGMIWEFSGLAMLGKFKEPI